MNIEKPDTPMKDAYAGVLRNGAQLLAEWRSGLSGAREKELAEFERKGLTLKLMIGASVQVILIDAKGGIMPLCDISAAFSDAVN